MDDNLEEILRLAQGLGQAIRKHPRYQKLMEADAKVRADKAATDALDAYNRAYAELAQKEQRGQPIEVEDKHRLERLKQVVAGNETFKVFLRAQTDYAELMQKMNDAIFKAISAAGEGPSRE
jgi:cell fate (sporulation/competence/biofilm development) regulator YlbF (YheA/YmcA/DUF963 family)